MITSQTQPLTNTQIAAIAPAIFAEQAHESRSSRYGYIPTSQVLAGLRKEGFEPFWAAQCRSRSADKVGHAKHMLRLRHASVGPIAELGTSPEIVLVNSHDGSSSYKIMLGFWRIVCSNGLIVGDELASERITHRGDPTDQVIEASYRVLETVGETADRYARMSQLQLSSGQAEAFAAGAIAMRWPEAETLPVTERQVLQPRRRDDTGIDLWTRYNVVQENLVRGGLRGRTAQNTRRRTRAVTGIDGDIALNRGLSVLSERMAELLKAA